MPSSADLLLVAAALMQAGAPSPVPGSAGLVAPPADLPQGEGPRGTSGQQRADRVGYAAVGGGAGLQVATNDLPPGSIAEVTELGTGTIALAQVVPGAADGGVVALLSPALASALLAEGPRVPVRVRRAVAAPAELAALAAGQAGSARMPAPAVLLTALRRRLPAVAAPATSARASPVPRAAGGNRSAPPGPSANPLPASRARAVGRPVSSGWFVQVAALSDAGRAQALAAGEHGRVVSGGGLHRVRLGPFASQTAAQSARDAAVRRGYAGAQIVHVD
ncbi:SPOR domain-containing protein [Sphingomonas aracearum]|uniref:SPOR domain-containing protein n=1 Tax=Sphingomonas aracearum TaxID=2283317 RepID=A0A369VTV3_9SPHN|nr:SPOR domain-containing protein [Sphingomonas aracearum]RDE05065.1 SPOR domain-containing protein [Sphingomonas aracearum]